MTIRHKLETKVNNCLHVDDDILDLSSGDSLTKFVAVDDGRDRGDYSVEIHGFRDLSGNVIITNAIVLKPEENKESK